MKNFGIIFLLIISAGLGSCTVGFNNFNKQKFTGLKSIKAPKNQAENNHQSELISADAVEEAHAVLEDQNPLTERLKSAIEDEEEIVIKKDGKLYRMQNAVYDQFVDAIIGTLVPLESSSDLPSDFLEVEVSEISTRAGVTKVFMSSVLDVKEKEYYPNSGTLKNKDDVDEEEGDEDFDSPSLPLKADQPDQTAAFNARFPEKSLVAHENWIEGKNYKYEGSYKNAHYRAARRAFRASLFWLLMMGIGIGILIFGITTIWVFASIGIGLIALSVVVGLALLIKSNVAMRRFRNQIGKAKFSRLSRAKSIRALTVLGLLLFGSIPFLIPFLIFMLISSVAAGKDPSTY